jgi:hypothetical protein
MRVTKKYSKKKYTRQKRRLKNKRYKKLKGGDINDKQEDERYCKYVSVGGIVGGSKENTFYILSKSETYHLFKDYIVSIETALNNLNINTKNIQSESFDDNYFIDKIGKNKFIISQTADYISISDDTRNKIKDNIYILDTESLFKENFANSMIQYLNIGYKIIEPMLDNIEILKSKGGDIKNIIYIPYQVNDKEIININKINSLGIIGAGTERRLEYIDYINSLNIIPLNNVIGFDRERNNKLFPSKFYLNIHSFDNMKIWESFRNDRILFNKIIIINEKSNEGSIPDEIKQYLVEFNNKEELKNILTKIMKNPDEYYNNFWKGFNLENIKKIRFEYIKKFLSLNY